MALRQRVEQVQQRRGRGELETAILGVLWNAQAPMTPADVQRALPGDLAYNTVQTILARLLAKELVVREKNGRAHTYLPARGREELAAAQMHQLLERGQDHRAVLQRFVDGLDGADEAALRELVRSMGEDPMHPAD